MRAGYLSCVAWPGLGVRTHGDLGQAVQRARRRNGYGLACFFFYETNDNLDVTRF